MNDLPHGSSLLGGPEMERWRLRRSSMERLRQWRGQQGREPGTRGRGRALCGDGAGTSRGALGGDAAVTFSALKCHQNKEFYFSTFFLHIKTQLLLLNDYVFLKSQK